MDRAKTKQQIKQLKKELKAANRTSDIRLLKLTLAMVIVALAAAYMYGWI